MNKEKNTLRFHLTPLRIAPTITNVGEDVRKKEPSDSDSGK
jgi:hypothetical protein